MERFAQPVEEVVSILEVALEAVVETVEIVLEERPYSKEVEVASSSVHFDFVIPELALVAMEVACRVVVEDETCSWEAEAEVELQLGNWTMVEEEREAGVDVPWVEWERLEAVEVEPPCHDDDASYDAVDDSVVPDDDDDELASVEELTVVHQRTIDEVCRLDSMDFGLPTASQRHFRVFLPLRPV